MAGYESSNSGQRFYSLSRLGVEFNLHRSTVTKRLRGCTPTGQVKGGHPGYTLEKAAPYLVDDRRDPEDGEDLIDPDRLAPEDQNQYYAAQLKKIRLEQERGDSWPTEKVADIFSAYNKTVTMSMRGLPELLGKLGNLDAKQKEIVRKEINRALMQLHEQVVDNFGGSAELPDDQ